jgi:hypothetical protein
MASTINHARGPRLKQSVLRVYGLSLLGVAAMFIVVFYVFFAANNGMYFTWPYDYPQIGPTPVQIAFPVALGIAMFVALLFAYVAVSNFKRPKPNKPANIVAAVFAILAIGAGGVMGYFASANVSSWYYDAGPYLTWSNGQDPATCITVSWHSALSTTSTVRYGTSPANLNAVISNNEISQFHHVPITGLQANTTYFYQVDVSPFGMKQFSTAPRGNASFSFTVFRALKTKSSIAHAPANHGCSSSFSVFHLHGGHHLAWRGFPNMEALASRYHNERLCIQCLAPACNRESRETR